jgi:hypothetical protein
MTDSNPMTKIKELKTQHFATSTAPNVSITSRNFDRKTREVAAQMVRRVLKGLPL